MNKAIKQLLREATAEGWTYSPTGAGHYKLTHPSGAMIFAPSTPSCYRALKNLRAEMKRQLRKQPGHKATHSTP